MPYTPNTCHAGICAIVPDGAGGCCSSIAIAGLKIPTLASTTAWAARSKPAKMSSPGCGARVHEEAGIECDTLMLRGTIKPGPASASRVRTGSGFIFRIDSWHGEPLTENAEGVLV